MTSKRHSTSLLACGKGNVAVETAVIAPVLLLMLIGLVDFGLALQAQVNLDGAARAGAQVGLVGNPKPEAVETAVLTAAGDPDGSQGVAAEVVLSCVCPTTGEAIDCTDPCDDIIQRSMTVVVSREHSTLFRYPGIPISLRLTSRVLFRLP
jgi:hypothetical protein